VQPLYRSAWFNQTAMPLAALIASLILSVVAFISHVLGFAYQRWLRGMLAVTVIGCLLSAALPERQRQRLQESGGSVQWQSQPGQGCQVTLELYGTAEHD